MALHSCFYLAGKSLQQPRHCSYFGINRHRFGPCKYASDVTSEASQSAGCFWWDVGLRAEHLFKRTHSDVELNRDPRASFRFLAERRDGILTPGDCWFALGALVFVGEPGLESGV